MKPEQISALTSIVAVVIALASLVWSVILQHNSQKPYVVAYLKPIRNNKYTITYLVIKNFGKTGAYISSVQSDKTLIASAFSDIYKNNPFEELNQSFIAPGQTFVNALSVTDSNSWTLATESAKLSFKVKSESGIFYHRHSFQLDLKAAADTTFIVTLPDSHAHGTVQDQLRDLVVGVYESSNEESVNRL